MLSDAVYRVRRNDLTDTRHRSFIIDTYRSMLLCFVDFVVHGSLDAVISLVEDAEDFVTDSFQEIREALQSAVEGVNSALEATVDNTINIIPGVDIDAPTVDVPELSAVDNVTIPTSIVTALASLNNTIPTIDELREALNLFIAEPIDSLRTEINTTMSNATVDVELLPVPAKQSVDLCTGLDTSFIDDIGHELAKSVKTLLGITGIVLALIIVGCAVWERSRYRKYLQGVQDALTAVQPVDEGKSRPYFTGPGFLSLLALVNNPSLASALSKLEGKTRLSASTYARLFWFLSYVFHPWALPFLVLGLFGLIIIEIQLAIINGPVRDHMQDVASDGVADFSNSLTSTVNANLQNSSSTFSTESNELIVALETALNDDLFDWVNTTTESLNTTINSFYSELTDILDEIFGGTPLETSAESLIGCLVGSKVETISSGLTWLHEHAHIDLPRVDPDVLLLSSSNDMVEELSTTDSSVSPSSIVNSMLERYADLLRSQRLGYIICLAIWLLVVLFGCIGLWLQSRRRPENPFEPPPARSIPSTWLRSSIKSRTSSRAS